MRLKIVTASLVLCLGSAYAEDSARTAEDIRQCSRANFPQQTAVQEFDLTSSDQAGVETRQKGKLSWRNGDNDLTQINICFTAPATLNGSCYLVLEKEDTDDIFVYLPSINRVKRVIGGATSQTLLGTDISYADLKQLQGLAAGGSLKRLEDGKLGELPVYVLEGRPNPSQESPYVRVVSHIDKQTCVPLQVDFYAVGDVQRKQLTVEHGSLAEVEGRWQVRDLKLEDMHHSTVTTVKFGETEYDGEIAKRVFNMRSFYVLN